MALTASYLKLTESDAVVKVAGNGGDITISLADLVPSTQVAVGDTLVVNIIGVRWNGELSNTVLISRNDVRVLTLPTETADTINFDGQELPPENTEYSSDIVVEQVGTGYVELYLKLRKVAGYMSKVEYAEYGAYDDETRIGASTTVNGSPDYTPGD